MKNILVTDKEDSIPDAVHIEIEFPQTLGNPLRTNERWTKEFILENYQKYITMKLAQKDEKTLAKLDQIANLVIEGKQVVLVQGTMDVHGEWLAKYIHKVIGENL